MSVWTLWPTLSRDFIWSSRSCEDKIVTLIYRFLYKYILLSRSTWGRKMTLQVVFSWYRSYPFTVSYTWKVTRCILREMLDANNCIDCKNINCGFLFNFRLLVRSFNDYNVFKSAHLHASSGDRGRGSGSVTLKVKSRILWPVVIQLVNVLHDCSTQCTGF